MSYPVRSGSSAPGPLVLVTLGLLAAAAPLGTDLYLSAFPSMTEALDTSAVGVQLSLTTFLVGAGVGQALFGPWSDRAGRMLPLLVGLTVYVTAGVVAALAPTITVLIAARLLQGIGGSAGMVISRAMILDRTTGTGAAQGLNVMMAITGIAPIVAPLIGSLLVGPLGWRGLLWVVAGIAGLSLLATLLVLRESLPAPERQRRREGHQPQAWRSLLTPAFISGVVAFASTMGVLMSYISASPFVYQEILGLSEVHYGMAFAANAIGMSSATLLSARLVRSHDVGTLAATAQRVSGVGVLLVLTCALLGVRSWPLMVALFASIAPLGMVLGNITALALSSVSRRSTGLASAVLGMMQFAVAGLVAGLVGVGGETTALPMAVVMTTCLLVATTGLWVMRRALARAGPRRHDRPSHASPDRGSPPREHAAR